MIILPTRRRQLPPPTPDFEMSERYLEVMFQAAAPDSFVALRSPPRVENKLHVAIVKASLWGDGMDRLMHQVRDVVGKAIMWRYPLVGMPLATFAIAEHARREDILQGLAVYIDLDHGAIRTNHQRLLNVLGPPTATVWSGGFEADGVARRHLHYRLAFPTETPEQHARLVYCRKLMTLLFDGCDGVPPLSIPMRLPGSLHLKSTPRLVQLGELNPEVAIDLEASITVLEAYAAAEQIDISALQETPDKPKARPGQPRGRADDTPAGEPQADIELLISALMAIPNDCGPDFEGDKQAKDLRRQRGWNEVLMAAYAGSGGDLRMRDACVEWSRRCRPNQSTNTVGERWDAFATSPPTEIGAGTIFMMAKAAGWKRPSAPKAGNGDAQKFSEDELAIAFAEQYGQDLRFDHSSGAWFGWDGNLWRQDATQLGFDLVRALCRQVAEVGKASTVAAVERFARADRVFAVTRDRWDCDPWLLGTPEGTVDLRTGQLRAASQNDFISKCTSVAPAPKGSPCPPMWASFLRDVTLADADFARFLQQYSGYSLTGDTSEQALLFLWGAGDNGKSVLLETLIAILGDYAQTAPMEVFLASMNDRHPTELARMHGIRLIGAAETERGRSWNETRIKQLTGKDTISARFMKQDFFDFIPQFKLFFIGNYKPKLRDVSIAIKRRLNLAPFQFQAKRPDKSLTERLVPEHPGILRWMIDGCLDWQQNGLLRPKVVLAATQEYFADQDVLARWFADRCETVLNFQEMSSTLLTAFNEYLRATNEHEWNRRDFGDAMRQRGYVEHRAKGGPYRDRVVYSGLKLRPYSSAAEPFLV